MNKTIQSTRRRPDGEDYQGVSKRIRNSYRWQRTRQDFKEQHEYCADPFNTHRYARQKVSAEHVHHIEPLEDRPLLAFFDDNLAGLCTSCHSRIEQMERNGQPTAHLFVSRKRVNRGTHESN